MNIRTGNAQSALNRRQDADLQSRLAATTILQPSDIANKTSAARLLTTTLGGSVRAITRDDLDTFRRSARALGSKLQQGITAQELIDLSRPADRDRARSEISHAIATRLTGGDVLFTTSSGPHSRVSRHFVRFTFPAYGSFLSQPSTPTQAAAELVKASLKFDCDCEHHRYRFRYVTSAMGCNAGRVETGYPKLTNPTLTGIACKHVLRAAVELQRGPLARRLIAKMIAVDRARLTPVGKAKRQIVAVSRAEAGQVGRGPIRLLRTTEEAQKRAMTSAIRKAMPQAPKGSAAADIAKTIRALQSRQDIPSKAILQALRAVLQQHPQESA